MNLLPYHHLTINTPLTPAQVHQKLNEVIEPKKLLRSRFSKDHKAYQGTLKDNKFEVSRIINYRNSFLPLISGKIEPDLGGSVINITMKPHIFVIIFMLIWLSTTGGFFLLSIIAFLLGSGFAEITGPAPWMAIVGPAFMFIFGYALFTGGFRFEANSSIKFFETLFKDTL